MSIASEIERLSGIRDDIFTSITNKGVTVPETATFSSCPDLIDSIVTGGGAPSSFINTGFNATGETQYMREFTATQIYNPGIVDIERGFGYTCSEQTQQWPFYDMFDFFIGQTILSTGVSGLIMEAYSNITPSAFRSTSTGNLYYNSQFDPSNPTGTPVGIWYIEAGSPRFSAYTTNGSAFEEYHHYYGYFFPQDYWQPDMCPKRMSGASADLVNPGYPYPTYPSATTGYISAGADATEYFEQDNPWVYSMHVSAEGYKEIYYDNSPHPGGNSGLQFNSGNVAIDENTIENTCKEYVSNSAIYEPLSGYTYEFGAETTSYNGYHGW